MIWLRDVVNYSNWEMMLRTATVTPNLLTRPFQCAVRPWDAKQRTTLRQPTGKQLPCKMHKFQALNCGESQHKKYQYCASHQTYVNTLQSYKKMCQVIGSPPSKVPKSQNAPSTRIQPQLRLSRRAYFLPLWRSVEKHSNSYSDYLPKTHFVRGFLKQLCKAEEVRWWWW